MSKLTNEFLRELLLEKASERYVEEYMESVRQNPGDYLPEILGDVIAYFFEWDCIAIARTFSAALTDANWHSKAAEVDEWIRIEMED